MGKTGNSDSPLLSLVCASSRLQPDQDITQPIPSDPLISCSQQATHRQVSPTCSDSPSSSWNGHFPCASFPFCRSCTNRLMSAGRDCCSTNIPLLKVAPRLACPSGAEETPKLGAKLAYVSPPTERERMSDSNRLLPILRGSARS